MKLLKIILSNFISLTMIGIGLLWIKYPPKNINYIYGYRSKKSMVNIDSWNFAHKEMTKYWRNFGLIGFIFSTIVLCITEAGEDIVEYILIGQLILMLIPLLLTEIALRRNFDKDGNKK